MKTNNLPDGYTCGHCGRYAKFSAWLFAHWHEVTIHTCECGARSEIVLGRPATLYLPRAFYLAAGEALDTYGERYGIERNPVEADADYRARILSQISFTYPTKGK